MHTNLCVTHRGRRVVRRTEVAVPVGERESKRPVLHQTHEGVIDRAVTVRVQTPHDLTDWPRALGMPTIAAQTHVVHRVEDATLHGFEAVAGVR